MLRYDGEVAIVTGAGNGLGREHALLLAARGAKVVVNDVGGSVGGDGAGDAGPARAVVEEIEAAGGEAVADAHSVATPEGGRALVDTALERWGRLDVLVNNAGILRNALFEDMTPELLERVLDVHLRGAFFVSRPAWDAMRERGGGRIVNTTSAAGLLGNAGMTNYGAAKGGVYGLTRVLAVEGEQYGIAVNAVAPIAATRMLTESMGEGAQVTDPAALEAMKAAVALLDPALVSPVVAYLGHRDCAVNGEVYSVGGGQVARMFLGRTRGWHSPTLTPEDVRDHLAEIRDTEGFTVPASTADESAELMMDLAGRATAAR